jgi:hypothetical protein
MSRHRARTAAVIGAAALLVLLAAAAPWLIGLRAEHHYHQALAGLAARGYRIVSDDYRRGWLRSRAETVVAADGPDGANAGAARDAPEAGDGAIPGPMPPDPGAAAPPRLRLVSRIEHGPRAGEWSRWPPVLASSRSRLTVVGGPRRLPPLRVEAVLSVGGAVDGHLRLPDVTYSGAAGRLHLSEVRGRARLDAARTRLLADGQVVALEALGADGRQLALRGLSWELGLSELHAVPVGEVMLVVDGAGLDAAADTGGAAVPGLDAGGLELRMHTRRERNRFGVTAVLGLERLLVDDRPLAPLRLGMSLSGVDAVALTELRAARSELAARRLPAVLRGLAIARLLRDKLPALLRQGPSLSIAPLSMNTRHGAVAAELAVMLPPAAVDAVLPPLDRPDLWLSRLQGEGRVELPRRLALDYIEEQQRRRVREELARRGEAAGAMPPELDRQVAAAAAAALAGLVRERWLVPADGVAAGAEPRRLRAMFSINDGILTINGRTLPLSAVAGP